MQENTIFLRKFSASAERQKRVAEDARNAVKKKRLHEWCSRSKSGNLEKA
jgi:hypothetical protein